MESATQANAQLGITSRSMLVTNICPSRKSLKRGMTLVEVVVSITLFFFLCIGGIGGLTTLHKMSRKQSTYNSVMALVVGKQEEYRSKGYAPPLTPFTDATTTSTETKAVSLNATGSESMVDVTLTSTIEPVSSGHLVTVTATYPSGNRTATVASSTVINNYSAVK